MNIVSGVVEWPCSEPPVAGCIAVRPDPPLAPAVPPYKIRIYLVEGVWLDMGVTLAWPEWLERYRFYGGIAHDKGFIERLAVKFIIHLDAEDKPAQVFEGNVVPLRRET